MVLDLKHTSFKQQENTYPVNSFLEEFSLLRENLKTAFRYRRSSISTYATVIHHTGKMKEFLLENGGRHAVRLLVDYETCIAIGDYSTCTRLEKNILSELDAFRECWISLVS